MMDERVTCRHYSDLSFGRCTLGIKYSMVCRAGESDDDTMFPCFKHHGVSDRCEHAEFPTPGEELAARKLQRELIIFSAKC